MILTSVFGPLSSGAGIPVLIGAAAFVPGFIIGRAKSRQRQAYPLERDAAAAAQDIQNYHHVLQDLQSRRQALQQKLDQFSVWCAVSPREPSIRTAPVADLIEYNVILTFAGANTIGVIKALREVTNLGLREAKGLVDSAPQTIKAGVEKAEADNIQVKLTSAGATVVLQAMP
jgi:large subunit ribosomal protein L7/L12